MINPTNINKDVDKMEIMLTHVIQEKSDASRSQFIETYMPFIVKQVAMHIGRYVRSESDDALIVGMEAFNEAIDKYDPVKGSFINFASIVIKSRIQDYLRIERRIFLNESLESPESLSQIVLEHSPSEHNENVIDDINLFKQYLSPFGITMEHLTQSAPTHKKTRREIILLCQNICNSPIIVDKMLEKKNLPMSDILIANHTSKKILKTHRDFIIACIIIIHFDIDTIKSHLDLR